MEEILSVLLGVILSQIGLRLYRSERFRSKIRSIEWGDSFISLWPNPGFQIGKFHWCKAKGWHAGFRPNKEGLEPGTMADEGTELYEKRMAYTYGPQWAQDPNYKRNR